MKITLACNDWRNGNFRGTVDAVNIEADDDIEPMLALSGNEMPCGYTYDDNKRSGLWIGDLRDIVLLGYARWAGNWCWDMACINDDDAVRIINYLMGFEWDCDCGYGIAYRKYENAEYITAEDFALAI